MAYTQSPSQSTYSSEDVDLAKEIVSRAGNVTKDEDYINIFPEEIKNKATGDKRFFLLKRAGTSSLLPSATVGSIRGSAFWEDQSKLFYAVGNKIYIYDFVATTTTVITPFGTTTGSVGFAEFLFNDGTKQMVASDGTTLIEISTTNTVTTCTDTDLPTPHDPNILFIDGYILVVKVGTSDFYNSDNNNPMSWTAGNFLSAEIEAATIKRLFKVSNYVVAATEETLEYFWDAGIATGSPFQRNDTPVKRISFLSAPAQEQNTTYFIGKELNSDIQVYKLYDFKCEPVGTPTLSRYLNSLGTDYNSWIGTIVSYQGHKFYVVNAGSKTYAMDLESGLWSRLAYQQNVNFNFSRAHGMRLGTSNSSIFALNDGTTAWYKFDETIYQDNGVNFSCVVVTDATDFGTLNRKSMSRLSLYADRPPVDSNILIQWSDDDYQTYNIGLSTNLNQDLACIRQLGNFRQRAFKLTHTDNTLLRIQGMVADINKGST